MAQTLLDGINEVLKRVGVIDGDDAALTATTDAARQRTIDVAIQCINEGVDELYSATDLPMPTEQKESTFTLVQGTRSYALESDLVQLRWPLIDKSNNQYLFRFPGGYNDILILDPEQDDTGLPQYAAISPVNGELYLERAPDAQSAGRTYTYQYDRDLSLSDGSDTVPFTDAVFRAMVPAWVQLWKREMRNEFDGALFRASIGRASRFLTRVQPRSTYSPR